MVERDGTLIGEEDLPLAEVEFIVGAGGGSEEGGGESLGEGTA